MKVILKGLYGEGERVLVLTSEVHHSIFAEGHGGIDYLDQVLSHVVEKHQFVEGLIKVVTLIVDAEVVVVQQS